MYAKTMAAFSNAKGGYIVFDVTDSPRGSDSFLTKSYISLCKL